MATLRGTVSLSGLPPNRGLIVNLCLHEVDDAGSPPPNYTNPSVESAAELHKIVEQIDLERESTRSAFVKPFRLEHRPGLYYAQLRVILFRKHRAKMLAQLETFFFGRRPLKISEQPEGQITFPIKWPETPVEDLGHIDTIHPQP